MQKCQAKLTGRFTPGRVAAQVIKKTFDLVPEFVVVPELPEDHTQFPCQ